ncbi:hypothetical protein ACQ4PT_055655 [Festuca glaucescens]
MVEDSKLSDDDLVMEDDFEKGTGAKRFGYKELSIATNNFSGERKLGEGGFGSVYTEDSSRKQTFRWQSRECPRTPSKGRRSMSPRYDVILGLGSALLYLHQDWEQCVLHRDIKPSNIMLDMSFSAKLGDFGLARLVNHGRGPYTTGHAGTMGYMDPECVLTGRTCTESDVYSSGVVLLEIACGRRPAVAREEDDDVIHLVQWVQNSLGDGRITDVADVRLNKEFDDREMECVRDDRRAMVCAP